jgi:rRNA maturation protein Nop10
MAATRKKQDEEKDSATILETCPVCGSAVGDEDSCTQCGAGLDYYRQPAAPAQSPAETGQTDAANTDKASE